MDILMNTKVRKMGGKNKYICYKIKERNEISKNI